MIVPTLKKIVTSTSQTLTADRCLRQWFLDKIVRVKPPEKHATVLGGALHEQVECFETGKPIYAPGWDKDLSLAEKIWIERSLKYAIDNKIIYPQDEHSTIELAICMLLGQYDTRGLPMLGNAVVKETDKGIRVVQEPTTLLGGGELPPGVEVYYAGFIDRLEMRPGKAIVIDHKTAKNKKWAKTSKKLKIDDQVNNYALYAFILDPTLEVVTVRHNIFLKEVEPDDDPVYVVETEVNLEDALLTYWHKLERKNSEMLYIRKNYPLTHDKKSVDRGIRFKEIPGAIDSGDKKIIRDGCDAFGGCPYSDLCKGHCTIQQLTARFDDTRANVKTNTTRQARPQNTNRQEKDMVFENIESANTQVEPYYYMNDPQTGVAYKCKVFTNDGNYAEVGVYPEAAVEPNWDSIPPCYKFKVPSAQILQNNIAMPLGDYQGIVQANNTQGALDWMPAPVYNPQAQNNFQQHVEQNGQQPWQGQQHPQAQGQQQPQGQQPQVQNQQQIAAVIPVPAPNYQPAAGKVVEVLESADQFWGEHRGKRGIITNIGPDGLLDVEMGGLPYTAVEAGRFKEITYNPADLNGNPQHDAPILVNQLIHLEITNTDSPYRGELSAQDPQGIVVMGVRYRWDQIIKLEPMAEVAVPGDIKGAETLAKDKKEKSESFMEVMGNIRSIIAAVQEKKTPTLAKRQQEELLHLLEVLEGKDEPGGAAPDVNALANEYGRGMKDMENAVISVMNEVQQA